MTEQPVPTAFQQPPRMAQHFKDNVQAQEQEQQPEPMTVTVPPARPRTSTILPQETVAPVQPSVAPPAAVDSGQESAVPLTPAPSYDAQWQKQLEAERQAFAQREQQWSQAYTAQQQQLDELRKAQQELAQYKQRDELGKQFADDSVFEGLETVDANDARRIIQMSTSAISGQLAQERAQFAQEREQLQQQLQQTQAYAQQQAQASQAARMRDQVLAAHPDFFQLYDNDPAFQQYLRSRDGKSSYTREQLAMAEYNVGNTAYLIDLLDRYKSSIPKPDDIKTVAPVQVANAAPVMPQAQTPQYSLSDLNYLFHTGRITQDQYRQELNRLRATQPQPA